MSSLKHSGHLTAETWQLPKEQLIGLTSLPQSSLGKLNRPIKGHASKADKDGDANLPTNSQAPPVNNNGRNSSKKRFK